MIWLNELGSETKDPKKIGFTVSVVTEKQKFASHIETGIFHSMEILVETYSMPLVIFQWL
jgi:hypothetical protein